MNCMKCIVCMRYFKLICSILFLLQLDLRLLPFLALATHIRAKNMSPEDEIETQARNARRNGNAYFQQDGLVATMKSAPDAFMCIARDTCRRH